MALTMRKYLLLFLLPSSIANAITQFDCSFMDEGNFEHRYLLSFETATNEDSRVGDGDIGSRWSKVFRGNMTSFFESGSLNFETVVIVSEFNTIFVESNPSTNSTIIAVMRQRLENKIIGLRTFVASDNYFLEDLNAFEAQIGNCEDISF
jgi:hypothetical protein